MPRATTWDEARPSTRSPANSMRPARSGRSPETARRVVVFPAPLLPIRATVSPSRTSSDASCTAVMSPYPTWMPSSLRRMDILFPEVRLDDPAIGRHLARRARRYVLAEREHDDPMREGHDRAHVVLDQEHGD